MDECIRDITLNITRQLTCNVINNDLNSINFSGSQNVSSPNFITNNSNANNNNSINSISNAMVTPSTPDIIENKSNSQLVLNLNTK